MKIFLVQILLLLLFSGLGLKAQDIPRFFPEKELVTTGIYFYPEHWNENQWERDLKPEGGVVWSE